MTQEAESVVKSFIADGIATVSLNRPERLNAWDDDMEDDLRAAMLSVSSNPDVKVIVLTGEGKAFCAGADMRRLERLGQGKQQRIKRLPFNNDAAIEFRTQYSYFPAISKPVICAINGAVAGIAFTLALYCDLRFASDRAVFVTSFARRGLVAEHGASYLLPALVGQGNAMDLMLSGRKIDAQEAYRIGLVERIFPHDELLARTYEYARMLVESCSPRAMGIIKRQVWEAPTHGLRTSIDVSDMEIRLCMEQSEDFREGVAHFLEKRPARFTGR